LYPEKLVAVFRLLKQQILFVMAALGGGSLQANAAPSGGAVVGGNGSISQSGSNTTILQNSQNMAIDWQSYYDDAR